ncbi:MAG: hypothetical protein WCK78_04360 [Paludibacter sp.]
MENKNLTPYELATELLEKFRFTGIFKRRCALVAVEFMIVFSENESRKLLIKVKEIIEKL